MKNIKKSKFFELLLLNDNEKLKDYLISNGKEPKVISPISFKNKEDIQKDDKN